MQAYPKDWTPRKWEYGDNVDPNYKGAADLEKRRPEVFPFLETPLYEANTIVTRESLPPKGIDSISKSTHHLQNCETGKTICNEKYQ